MSIPNYAGVQPIRSPTGRGDMNATNHATFDYLKNEPLNAGRPLARIVTTSWDDGDLLDLRVAEILHSRKIVGTFYVPISGHHGPFSIGRSDLRALAAMELEIGAHGLSHVVLPRCSRKALTQEVEASKKCLEDMMGSEVRMFAYPRGRYNNMAIRAVKHAGYAGARTTQMLAQSLSFDPYRMPTTVHVFPHSKPDYVRNAARAANFGAGWKYLTRLRQVDSWVELAKLLFDSVSQEGGIFHLYGHSWEIDELDLWDELEEVLDYVSHREGVFYLSNAEILDYIPARNPLNLRDQCPTVG